MPATIVADVTPEMEIYSEPKALGRSRPLIRARDD